MREEIRRKDNENFFAGVKLMNNQLKERAEEYNESLQDQERKGMIILRPQEDILQQQQRVKSLTSSVNQIV